MTFGVVGLDPAPFELGGHSVLVREAGPVARILDEFSDAAGLAFELTTDPDLRARCDFIDGIAKRVGAIDTISFQPAGSSHLIVGFAALPGALGRAMTEVLGEHSGRKETPTTAVIVGAGESAACAIAAAVQHDYDAVVIASDTPGPAIGAAHRMDLDVDIVPLERVEGAHIDLLINTAPDRIAARPSAVCDLSGAWAGFGGPYVSGQLITAHQRQDQVRVLTGKSPQLTDLLAAL